MTEETKQYFEEIIFKAVQSGKQETSGLVNDVLRRMDPAIEKSIEKYVNGKINRLDQKITDYIENDDKWKEDHLKANEKLITIVNENTEFRLRTTGGIVLLQFILGFFGLGTIINLIVLFTK